MGDMAEDFNFLKAHLKERRKERIADIIPKYQERLQKLGYTVQVLSEQCHHWRVGDFDYWPTTGRFINRITKKRNFGISNLIKSLKAQS